MKYRIRKSNRINKLSTRRKTRYYCVCDCNHLSLIGKGRKCSLCGARADRRKLKNFALEN